MKKEILSSYRNEDGSVVNKINAELFNKANTEEGISQFYLFTFVIKTLIDDFGESLRYKNNKEKAFNKEQLEAYLIKELTELLSVKTRRDE